MSEGEIIPQSQLTNIGEAEGAHDGRVKLLEDKAGYISMLGSINNDLEGAFPTIAGSELRTKLMRAITIIDELISTDELSEKESQALQELDVLEYDIMRAKRSHFIEEKKHPGRCDLRPWPCCK